MSHSKQGYARYTFAFASDVQKLADEKRVRVLSFNTTSHKNRKGSYDVLSVRFLIPRPDRDLDNLVNEIENELEDELGKEEENKDEI